MPVRVREVVEAIWERQYSCVDHVREVLDRLSGDRHNAVVRLLTEAALAEAVDRDAAQAAGVRVGPLHGLAVVIKDIIDVAGAPTRCGSDVLREAPDATADAPVVAALRRAGAVIVAKTHTHEFAFGPTGDVAAEGPCRNPHDPSRMTGGSSSGSAAAVAAGHVALAVGTDTGCSVRTPAALCGVAGLKPLFGSLPTDGVFPLSETCDHVGLLARDADGARLGWDALRPDAAAEDPPAPRSVVIGRPRDPYWTPADPAITEAVDAAAAALTAAGHTVIDVPTPGIGELAPIYRRIVGAEAYATHARWLAQRRRDYQPVTAARLAAAAEQTARDYVEARRACRAVVGALHARLTAARVEVLLTATTPITAPPIGAVELPGLAGGPPLDVRSALLSQTLPFNLAGWPALSVPAPEPAREPAREPSAQRRLPIGLQLVAVPGASPRGVGERGLVWLAGRIAPVPAGAG